MFNRKRKTNNQHGSKESVGSSGEMSGSSTENLAGTREGKEGRGLSAELPPSRVLGGLKVQFQVYYLGMVQEISMQASAQRDNEAQLIDRVEEAQMEGKLPIVAQDRDTVILNVSLHGIKVLDSARQDQAQAICQSLKQLFDAITQRHDPS